MKKIKENKYRILSLLSKYSFIIIFVFMMVLPFMSVSADNVVNASIKNPLGEGNLETIPEFIKKMVEIVLVVGIPIIAVAIIYTGFLFVAAQGNSEKITKAKNALMYVLIGGALLLGAFVIANAIGTTVDEIKKGNL